MQASPSSDRAQSSSPAAASTDAPDCAQSSAAAPDRAQSSSLAAPAAASTAAPDRAQSSSAAPTAAAAPADDDVFALPFSTRAVRAARALGKLLRDPYDTEQVFVLSTNINVGSIRRRLPRFFASADGSRLFRENRSIDTAHVDLDALAALPDGTLGREYVRFLRDRGLSPDIFQAPANVHDPRAAYVLKRIRQTHDLWHLVTGHATNPAGEIALQAFTFGQLGAPSSLLIALAGTARSFRQYAALPREVLEAYRAGRRAAPLAAFLWEDHWATPLSTLRPLLNIIAVAPNGESEQMPDAVAA